jgi:tryptophan synthase beta chain
MHSVFLQNESGQISEPYSISAGMDYPGVGPEHTHLYHNQRCHYLPVTDEQTLEAFEILAKKEGIIPAFEPAHAIALVMALVEENKLKQNSTVLINLSGRGDKDLTSFWQYKHDKRA